MLDGLFSFTQGDTHGGDDDADLFYANCISKAYLLVLLHRVESDLYIFKVNLKIVNMFWDGYNQAPIRQ